MERDHYSHGFCVGGHVACAGAIIMAAWMAGVEENPADSLCSLFWKEPCCSFRSQVGTQARSERTPINGADSSQMPSAALT